MADSNPQVKAMISNPQLMKQMLGQISTLFFIQTPRRCRQP